MEQGKTQLFWVDNYQLCNQLVANDEAFVDTDIIPSIDMSFSMIVKFRYNSNVNGPGNAYFGAVDDLGSVNMQAWESKYNPEAWSGFGVGRPYAFLQSFNDRKVRFAVGKHMFWQANGSTTNPTPDTMHEVEIFGYQGGTTAPSCKVDGNALPLALNSTFSAVHETTSTPLTVFCIGEANGQHRCFAYPGTSMKYLKLFNKEMGLVNDLRPAISGSHVGLADVITSKFYPAVNCEVIA